MANKTNRKIKASYSYTRNLGNYESCKIEMGTERDLLPDEKFEKVLLEELDFVKELVEDEIVNVESLSKT